MGKLLKFLIIWMFIANIKIAMGQFLSGNFTYCYGKTIKMPLLDTRRDCAEILAPKPKNQIIENKIRGLNGYIASYFTIDNEKIKVLFYI